VLVRCINFVDSQSLQRLSIPFGKLVCFVMHKLSSSCLQVTAAQLRLGFVKHRMVVTLPALPGLLQLLRLLQQNGVLMHFERGAGGVKQGFRAYLQYRHARPAARFVFFLAKANQTCVFTYAALRTLARTQAGVSLYLNTPKGVQSLAECLKARVGGRLLLAVYPN
jgi:ribosomal protein S8